MDKGNAVSIDLLEACEAALKCIARLTPLTCGDECVDKAIDKTADYADEIRDILRHAIKKAKGDWPIPCFGVWIGKYILSLRVFYRLFQIKLVHDELFSQQHDTRRIRFMGLSIKLFGK